ncbi:MAG TPA: hypothetical protein VGR07_03195, partial [Thermoanaerobaculia bacterium]|nr:hypothetical protein [Thermoanaerobaculia bacterium]
RALALLAEGLARQGQLGLAREPAERARALAGRSDDSELQVVVTTSLARVNEAAGIVKGPEAHLQPAITQAGKLGLVPAGLEARWTLGAIQSATAAERSAGLQVLAAVRREAALRGFKLMAQRAEAALKTATLGARPLG